MVEIYIHNLEKGPDSEKRKVNDFKHLIYEPEFINKDYILMRQVGSQCVNVLNFQDGDYLIISPRLNQFKK